MEIRVPYGTSSVSAVVPDDIDVDLIELPPVAPAADPGAVVAGALADPLGGFDWGSHVGAGSVAIAVNDKTRPVPHDHLLPPLMDRLAVLGIPDRAITYHIASGAHPPMPPSEFASVLPADLARRCRVVAHDAECGEALVFLGETPAGTPVWVDREFAHAELKIVVGTIAPHQFVGFSGGVKSAAIGLAGRATINANHTLMTHPDSRIGTYADNPARQDVEEIGRLVGVDLALNAILDPQRRIVRVLAGEPVAVMETGVPLAQQLAQVEVGARYGVVVASPGGHPKDIDVYQSQKAVAAAVGVVRPGGTIVLAAACPEGSGNQHYETWVSRRHSRHDVVATFTAEGFGIGPHKAYQLARDTEHARLIVCSDLPVELAQRLLLEPAGDLQTAVDAALADLHPGDHIAVLPHASSTIPRLRVPSPRR